MGEWKRIPGFEAYHATLSGEIIGPSGKALRPTTSSPRGYPHLVYFKVGLYRDGKRVWRYVHRLVCETFSGPPPPEYPDCSHVDHDTRNNAASNLAWCTHEDNCRERHTDDAAEMRAIRSYRSGDPLPDSVAVAGVPF